MRVLLVDDSTVFRVAAEQLLSGFAGVEVVGCFACAEEGLAQAALARPDLVLMDLAMPGMNGLQAVSLLKKGVAAPKAVVVTLHDTESHRSAAAAAGADGFIAKGDIATALPPLLEALFPGWRK